MASLHVIQPSQMDAAVTVLDLVRNGQAATRAEIGRISGLGRTVVNQRLGQLLSSGLLRDGELGPSTGGRAPRQLEFNASAGHVLVAHLGATGVDAAVSDLAGTLLAETTRPAAIADGPDLVLKQISDIFAELLESPRVSGTTWGIGVGLPGPVEFASGRPVSPPIMPGWDGFPVRDYFGGRYDVPTWVDNDVNLMALGELRRGSAHGVRDFLYVKIGSGIGAGLVSQGRLHRGAQGCAGDIGHVNVGDSDVVCRCGKTGCLEALAGGAALARDATLAADEGRSRQLQRLLQERGALTAADVGVAAAFGDSTSVELLTRSATLVGETLARTVNFFNPALILIGGGVAATGDLYLATIRHSVLARSLPLATRSLRIDRSPLGRRAGPLGAAFMVIDELMSKEALAAWIEDGSPAGKPWLATVGQH